MRTARQVLLGAADPLQQPAYGLDLLRLGIMRSTAEGELFTGEVEPLDHPILYQRESLERFGGGTEEGGKLAIARMTHDAAAGVNDDDRHRMNGLDPGAATRFDAKGGHVRQ